MKVSVWDTYVQRQDGQLMHFDILVPSEQKDSSKIFGFGAQYLNEKPFETGQLTASECQFCHIERATDHVVNEIQGKGFSIVEMENCN
ncbi:MAG: DUF2024 family protein [Bacteroidota bacterium]